MDPWLWTPGCELLAVGSQLPTPGLGSQATLAAVDSCLCVQVCVFPAVGSLLWIPGCGRIAENSWLWTPNCGLLALDSWR